jgi:hypothetical protein
MRVKIYNIYSDTKQVFEGDPAHVEAEILRHYSWLRSPDPEDQGDVAALVDHLNSAQSFEAEIEDPGEAMAKSEPQSRAGDDKDVIHAMLGYHANLHENLDAARFLRGGAPVPYDQVRRALWEGDGDAEEAALAAYGFDVSPASLKALRAVRDMSQMIKAETAMAPAEVEPGHPDAAAAAEAIKRAFDDHFVFPVELGGKHSRGSMVARDQETGVTWLLKPGVGATPAAGMGEDQASPSQREAAFWHVAQGWGLGGSLPETQLVRVDGREFAAIKLLPWSYRTLDKVVKEDPGRGRVLLEKYRHEGLLHKWAVLDGVLGNVDRHAQNVMVHLPDDDVKLIDHGSAMAGPHFDPVGDKYSFIPYYLRAWATTKFTALDPQAKLRVMPRVSGEVEQDLRRWLEGLSSTDLDKVLFRYGVDPGASRERLAKLKVMAIQVPVDEAVNRLWVGA